MSRGIAAVLDLCITLGSALLLYLSISAIAFVVRPRTFSWPDVGTLTIAVLWWVLLVLYLTVGWAASGRTLGMQVMGLRVVRADRATLRGARSALRALVCAIFPIGLAWCAVDRRRRAIHDLIVGTQVVYDWVPRGPASG